MRIVARAAGTDEDEDDDLLEAGFSENEDGSGIAVLFQRDLFVDPYDGPDDENDRFENTYMVVTGAGTTTSGGIVSIAFTGNSAAFRLNSRAAGVLKLDEVLEVEFQVPDGALAAFKTTLREVVTWGMPSQIPELTGL